MIFFLGTIAFILYLIILWNTMHASAVAYFNYLETGDLGPRLNAFMNIIITLCMLGGLGYSFIHTLDGVIK